MIKTILIAIAAIVASILIFASTKPDSFRVERKIVINTPPEKVFALINDFHQWDAWSPWAKLDPAMKQQYSGAANGKGAIYEWQGDKKVGKGRMEITDTTLPNKILVKLDFLEPFEGHNTAEYTMTPAAKGTEVTWAMFGPSPFVSKILGVFVSMDTMIGKDFEKGLANLKTLAEK